MNKIINKYQAIVDGKTTGLAGCAGCNRDCLRKNPMLEAVLPSFKVMKNSTVTCPRFIPIED